MEFARAFLPAVGRARLPFFTMRALVTQLLEAQSKLLATPPGSAKWRATARSLQQTIPAPILAHFLRAIGAGHPGVALVQHGVCSVCHIRVPSALVPALIKPHDLHLCDQCGSYLLLPENEIPPPHLPPRAAARRRSVPADVAMV